MPTYLYYCEECKKEFEEVHSMSIKLEFCPTCKLNGKETSVKRLIGSATQGTVTLTGQDLVDKVKSDAKQLQKDAAKNEKIYSNLLGENKYDSLQTQFDRRHR